MVSVPFFVSKFEERSFQYETQMDKALIRAQEHLGKGEKQL